jgi:hypothetical protein
MKLFYQMTWQRFVILLGLGIILLGGGWWFWSFWEQPRDRFVATRTYKGDLLATVSSSGTIEPEDVVDVGHVELYSSQKERARPEEADRMIVDAFRQVKEILRRRDPNGLWSTHNANYGFARNFLTSAPWGTILSLIAAAICGGIWLQTNDLLAFVGIWAEMGLAIVFLVCRLWVMAVVAKLHADRYAESAWETFLVITNPNEVISQSAATPTQAEGSPTEKPSTPT